MTKPKPRPVPPSPFARLVATLRSSEVPDIIEALEPLPEDLDATTTEVRRKVAEWALRWAVHRSPSEWSGIVAGQASLVLTQAHEADEVSADLDAIDIEEAALAASGAETAMMVVDTYN